VNRKTIILALIISIAVVVLAAAFASSHPDGLEWVARRLGFLGQAEEASSVSAPMPDYTISAIKFPFWSSLAAGTIGVGAVFLVTYLIGRLVRRR
jgi:hypothetical protein